MPIITDPFFGRGQEAFRVRHQPSPRIERRIKNALPPLPRPQAQRRESKLELHERLARAGNRDSSRLLLSGELGLPAARREHQRRALDP